MVVALLILIIVILLLGRDRFLGITGGLIKSVLYLLLAVFVLGFFVEDPWAATVVLGLLAITVVFVKRIL